MFQISKEFHFSASHQLDGLPEDHPCSRVHGHNYVATLTFASYVLDETGFVLDFRALDPFKKYVDDTLDHRHLNDVVSFNPTSESLAELFFDVAQDMLDSGEIAMSNISARLTTVSVKETEKTQAVYGG